jgi:hypothetical protein
MTNIRKDVDEIMREKDKARLKVVGMKNATQLSGKFWFSKRQRMELDAKGQHRMFVRLFDGAIAEYTEMCEFEDILSDPMYACEYEDATYLGEGVFAHFVDL